MAAGDLHRATCSICGGSLHAAHTVPERMFGFGGSYAYLECDDCGTLTLDNPPEDLGQFYPETYYAHDVKVPRRSLRHWVREILRPHPEEDPPALPPWFDGVPPNARILDVGSGKGELLRRLRAAGFTCLEGVDPFAAAVVEDGLTIRRGDVADLDGQFDLIMSHHSVEHIPEPAVFFRQLRRLVAGDGRILVRTPLADSWTYAHYGSDWWALDAPRHLHVFTTKAIHLLATRAGLRILDESRDSDPMQFHASELYRRGETLAGRTLLELDEQTVDEYRRRARELNDRRTGDFGVFWLAV